MSLRFAPPSIALLASGVLLAGCVGDAERGNPLDPLSDNFRDAGGVSGVVVRASAPSEPVLGASVRLSPVAGGAELVARVGGDGRFSLANVPSGRYVAAASATGYAPAADTVEVAAGRLVEASFQLDALPRVVAQRVRTERIHRFWPDPEIFSRLVVEAEVVDPDGAGDIAHVLLVVPEYDDPATVLFRDTLRALPNTAVPTFTGTFSEDDLPFSLQNFLGQNLFVEVTDRAGATVRGPDAHAVRIVESVPMLVGPNNTNPGVLAPNPPTFTWEPLTLPYTFTWRITLSIDQGGREVTVLSLGDIPASQTQVTLTEALPTNLYSWTISAVDGYGNLARSRPGGFRVVR